MKKERIRIGWAEADITPGDKCELYGQYYQRVSKGIHSPISATALAVESESGEQAIMISVDVVNFQLEFLNALRKKVKHLVPEIIPGKIIMGATHTHCAPSVSRGRNWWKPDPGTMTTNDYREFVLSRLADAVSRAWKSLSRGAVSVSRGYAVVGHCRRVVFSNGKAEMYGDTSRKDFIGLEGNEDSTVELLFTYDDKKNPSGVMVNVACPSQVMEATYLVSSDFMGELRRILKKRFGDGFHVLCQISAAGDQSPRDLVRNRNADFWNKQGVSILGRRLGNAVLEAYEKVANKEIMSGIEMAHKVRIISLPKWFPDHRELVLAEKETARLEAIMPSEKAFSDFTAEVKQNEKIPDRPGPYDSKLHHFVLIRNAEAVIKRSAERTESRDFEMELHTLRIGDVAFCTNPFELFLDYGLRIKARSRARQTFVVQLACGSAGYLPTKNAEKHGGYGGLIINGVIGAEGGEKLVDETVKDINSLF